MSSYGAKGTRTPNNRLQRAAQLLVTAANLERGYQAFRGSGNLQVFQPQVNELGRLIEFQEIKR
jgi:hypothetical protein